MSYLQIVFIFVFAANSLTAAYELGAFGKTGVMRSHNYLLWNLLANIIFAFMSIYYWNW